MKKQLQQFKRLISPTCAEVSFQLSCQQEEPLSLGRRFFLRVHLILCRLCRRYRRNLEFLRKALTSYTSRSEELVDHRALPPEVKERIKRRLRE